MARILDEPDACVIRSVRPSDAPALSAFYAALSVDSRARRFLGARQGISDDEAMTYATADHTHREGFLAIATRMSVVGEPDRPEGPEGAILAHLCLEPCGPGTAEFGIAVADPFQHHRIGSALLRTGVDWARDHGVRTLTATARVDNAPLLALVLALDVPLTAGVGRAGTMPLSLDLSPRR
ncbi:MAG: GNAT family N-acetyltransferase [Candidatus Limnocylindrales bacterium]